MKIMDEKKATTESLFLKKEMIEAFEQKFSDIFNEWGIKYGLKRKFQISQM